MSEHRPRSSRDTGHRRARSLRELPQEMMPEHDLWPQIGARLTEARVTEVRQPPASGAQAPQAKQPAAVSPAPAASAHEARPQPFRWTGWRVQLAAAVGLLVLGAALTLGAWITHGSAIHGPLPQELVAVDRMHPPRPGPVDARQREALLRSLNARLEALPPPSRQKVLADLAVIERSMRDIQSSLGRDPGNALLREMLLESYQDEQQLIATVQEAGVWTQEAGTGKGSI